MPPVVAEVVRNGFVESVHRGSIVVVERDGRRSFVAGDPSTPTLPRSSNKPLQAVAMVRLGLDLPPDLLALVCASHSGEPFHAKGVGQLLARYGLTRSRTCRTPRTSRWTTRSARPGSRPGPSPPGWSRTAPASMPGCWPPAWSTDGTSRRTVEPPSPPATHQRDHRRPGIGAGRRRHRGWLWRPGDGSVARRAREGVRAPRGRRPRDCRGSRRGRHAGASGDGRGVTAQHHSAHPRDGRGHRQGWRGGRLRRWPVRRSRHRAEDRRRRSARTSRGHGGDPGATGHHLERGRRSDRSPARPRIPAPQNDSTSGSSGARRPPSPRTSGRTCDARAGTATTASSSASAPGGGSPVSGTACSTCVAQDLEHLRDRHQHGNAARANLRDNFVGCEGPVEDDDAERSGGTNVAIAWPNMWLSGSRFRKRIGWNGRAYRYFAISRSIGTMLARMFRWVSTTPFGSEVAPDVKITSATSSVGARSRRLAQAPAARSGELPDRRVHADGSGTASPTTIARAPTMAATRRRTSPRRDSRSARRRRRAAGSPTTRRSTRAGSRPR